MQSYSFNEWVNDKDNLDEAWWNSWSWRQKEEQPPKRAGRALSPVGTDYGRAVNTPQSIRDRMTGMTGQPERPERQYNEPERQIQHAARPRGYSALQSAEPQMQQQRPQQQPQQKQTVSFSSRDLNKLRESLMDYINTIQGYVNFLHKNVPYSEFITNSTIKFRQLVYPYRLEVNRWVEWVKSTNAMVGMKKFYQKINYKNFEKMKIAVQNLNMAMTKWVNEISTKLPGNQGQRIKAVYQDHVVPKLVGLAKQVRWLDSKIQELFSKHGMGYGGLGAKGLQPSESPPTTGQYWGMRNPSNGWKQTYAS